MWLRTMSLAGIVGLWSLCGGVIEADEFGPPLPGTKPLTTGGDIASELVAGVDRFLLREIDESTAKRARATGSEIFPRPKAYTGLGRAQMRNGWPTSWGYEDLGQHVAFGPPERSDIWPSGTIFRWPSGEMDVKSRYPIGTVSAGPTLRRCVDRRGT